jgi:hypothetical protein
MRGNGMRNDMRNGVWRRLGACAVAAVLGASVFAGCTSARAGLGTTDESCYLALPTASKAVGGHGHLTGIRKYRVGDMKRLAPHLYDYLADQAPRTQVICLAGYTGLFSKSMVEKPVGRATGKLAVVVVTSPGNKVLATLILKKLPVRFQHTHPF